MRAGPDRFRRRVRGGRPLSLLNSDTRLLWDKEVQQLTRSWYAMLSSFVVPGALVVLGPVFAVVTEHFKRDYYAPSPQQHYAGVAVPGQAERLLGFKSIHPSAAAL